ncbi:type II toxin-antitoxin system ParD family antitoxin [Paraferrimonas sedimenticola]|nr:type II toxin-antitoxin system ParD family antitoxin [Paraferrimonas sedimenticola]
MNISLPSPMKDWVEEQANSGLYSNASDYVRDLIRQDQKAKLARFQALVSEGVQSGPGDMTMEQIEQAALDKLKG